MKRAFRAQAMASTGGGTLLRALGAWSGLLVLNYHRVGSAGDAVFDRKLWSANVEQFDEQVGYLKKCFDIVSPSDLPDVFRAKRGQFVMLTFDDGYRDNYEAAFPVLQTHGVLATFFVATGFIDRQPMAWWDAIASILRTTPHTSLPANRWFPEGLDLTGRARGEAIQQTLDVFKSLPNVEAVEMLEDLAAEAGDESVNTPCPELWMTWDMIREMQHAGMTIGGHTVSHPILSRLSPEGQDREIQHCAERLEQELGVPAKAFSYPVGGVDAFNEVTRAALRVHGFQWGFSYYGGYARPGHTDPYDIPRAAVESDLTQSFFRAMTTLPQLLCARKTPRSPEAKP